MIRARAACVAIWVVALVLCAAGCPPQVVRVPQPPGAIPTAADFQRAQEQRLLAIPTLALRGHAALQWTDGRGGHFDDGDFDFIARPPVELSLRLSKLGEKFLWVGGGGGQAWVIFPRESPTRAILRRWTDGGDRGAALDGLELGGIESLLEPGRMMEALGLSRIDSAAIKQIAWDERRGGWSFELPGRVIFARGESLLPVGCNWTNALGKVLASCTLEGFEWIRGERPVGSPPAAVQPLVATRIRFSIWSQGRCEGDGPPSGELALAAQEPSFGTDRMRPQLFNWDDVRAALRPEVIEGLKP
ncbi:MAG: hypothetical protein EXS01_01150 [Phycisphaerales bacterium]|nr:hypothetical protein [Phycisphaerales bacterium]